MRILERGALSKLCVGVKVHAEGKETTLHAIVDARNATRLGTVRATIECASRLDAVPDDLAMAMGACRGKGMDGALEAVERARRTLRTDHLKRLVVIISADITFGHHAISTSDGCIEHSSCSSI